MPLSLEQQFDSQKSTLFAINIMLHAINEPPVETEADLHFVEEAKIAMMVLIETKKEVLATGWDFNTDDAYDFPPDTKGFIAIPANVLDISATSGSIQMRNWKLYDTEKKTSLFDAPVSCKVVWDFEFNDLTHPLRQFVTLRAARRFQARQVGDQVINAELNKEEEEAYLSARRSETRTGGYNMLSGQYGQDNMHY